MDIVAEPRQRAVPRACSSKLLRRWKNGLALNVAYTLAHSDSNAPDTGNSTIGAGPVRSVRHREGPRPRSERGQAPGRGERDVGHSRRPRIASTARTCPAGPTRCSAAGRCRRSVQARSGQHLTPFFSGFYTTSPWNTGKPLDGSGTVFCCAWRPDQIERSEHRRLARRVLRPDRLRHSRHGKLGTRRRAACSGPARGWRTSRSTRTSFGSNSFRLQFSALLDNAFNHPQFFPAYRERVRRAGRLSRSIRRPQQRHDRRLGRRFHR